MLLVQLCLTAIWIKLSEAVHPAPTLSLLELAGDGLRIYFDQPRPSKTIRFHFVGRDRNGAKIFEIDNPRGSELILPNNGSHRVTFWYTSKGEKSTETYLEMPEDTTLPAEPLVNITGSSLVDGLEITVQRPRPPPSILYTFVGLNSRGDEFAFGTNQSSNKLKLNNCDIRTLFVWYIENGRESLVSFVNLTEKIYKPKKPSYYSYGDRRIVLQQDKDSMPVKGYLINENGHEYQLDGVGHELTWKNKTTLTITAIGMCDQKSESLILGDSYKPKKPSYYSYGDRRIVLQQDKDSMPVKGYLINENGHEYQLDGVGHELTWKNKTTLTITAIGMCDQKSESLILGDSSGSRVDLSPRLLFCLIVLTAANSVIY